MADLQRMLQKVVSSKKASARQKQAELIKVSKRLFWVPFEHTASYQKPQSVYSGILSPEAENLIGVLLGQS